MSKDFGKETLRASLAAEVIEVRYFQTLREVVIQDEPSLASLPQTLLEKEIPLYTLATTSETALSLWERLKKIVRQVGYYPVILGDKDALSHHWQHREQAKSPQEYLKQVRRCDAQRWFNHRWRNWVSFNGKETMRQQDWDENAQPLMSLNPKSVFFPNLEAVQYIGLIPTTISWQIPAYLAFGNWNSCPNPAIHCCIQRYWQTLYGSEIIVMTFDTIYCRLGSPITSRETALQLATEQVAYCPEHMGVNTLGQVASALLQSTYWCFWWD